MKEKYLITKTSDGKYEVEKEETNDARSEKEKLEHSLKMEKQLLKTEGDPSKKRLIQKRIDGLKEKLKKTNDVKPPKPIKVRIKDTEYEMVGFTSKKEAKIYAEIMHNTLDADTEKQHQNRVAKTKLHKEYEKLAAQLSDPKSDSKKLKKRMNAIASEVEKLDKDYKNMKTDDSAPKSKDEWKQIIKQFLLKAGIKGSVSYQAGGMTGEYYRVTVDSDKTDIDKLYNNVVYPFNRKYGDNKDYVYIVVNKK